MSSPMNGRETTAPLATSEESPNAYHRSDRADASRACALERTERPPEPLAEAKEPRGRDREHAARLHPDRNAGDEERVVTLLQMLHGAEQARARRVRPRVAQRVGPDVC